MRVVLALGGNALLRRGEPLTAENQRANVALACERIARIVHNDDGSTNEVVIAHGNGPQVGLLALQSAAYAAGPDGVAAYPLDVLGAQTEAMIGYVIEQELGNVLPPEQPMATLLTQIEVDPADPAFATPTKPIGPVYPAEVAQSLIAEHGWTLAPEGSENQWVRRVVASPRPQQIFEIRPIRTLLEAGTIVICAGGGGIPTVFDAEGNLRGVEAVIDKDLASSLLARELGADLLVIATDVDGVYREWGTPSQSRVPELSVAEADSLVLPAGSMGPKVQAAAEFARATGNPAVIGSLADIAEIVAGHAGTRVTMQ